MLIFILIVMVNSCKPKAGNNDSVTETNTDTTQVAEEPTNLAVETEETSNTDASALIDNTDETKLNDAQLAVQQFLKYCNTGNFAKVANMLAYKGKDETRDYKDAYDYSNATEQFIVESTGKVIKDWLVGSDDYQFTKYIEDQSDIGKIYVVEVVLRGGTEVNRRFFLLIKPENEFLVVDIKKELPQNPA